MLEPHRKHTHRSQAFNTVRVRLQLCVSFHVGHSCTVLVMQKVLRRQCWEIRRVYLALKHYLNIFIKEAFYSGFPNVKGAIDVPMYPGPIWTCGGRLCQSQIFT
ncbi:hypothetical protein N1851_000304 [Merluccius polli]|uniref:Uncharacterized protein n=1 Tax=Merluccius polli TaxID=89951 RepID=A0AA47NC80_MERPO|nr:hypothetical protein N1851_000304 [Merluccius polli]